MWAGIAVTHEESGVELPCEPAGHGEIATGSVSSCAPFWRNLAERGDHAVSYDLMSGYYHAGLHPRSRTFVGFMWEGQYYVCNCLPFGLSTAPWVFSKVMRELVMLWRKEGIRVLPYLDEFIFMARGFWQCVRLVRKVEAYLVRAGLRINLPKCVTRPTQ